jgi:multiple sugar transport system substrate-binding protein
MGSLWSAGRGWLLVGFAVLAGCSGPAHIVLRVSNWGAVGDDSRAAQIEREVYREFELEHPGVEVQIENTPGTQEYVQKQLLSYVAQTEPDVIRLDASSAAVFMDNGVVRDLTSFVNGSKGIKLGDYFPNVVDIARKGYSLYAIPVDFTPLVVYYNEKLFDAAEVPYPSADWTWDEFLAKARALTRGEQYGYTLTNWMAGWLPWIWTAGGDVIGPDGKAEGAADATSTVQAVTWIRDLVTKEKVAPSFSQLAAEGASPFSNGTAAMETSGHWNLWGLASAPKIELSRIGIAPLPVAKRGMKPVTVLYEAGLSIGAHCRNPDLAWDFIRYFTSQAVQRKMQTTGIGVCARKDIAFERAVNERERTFLQLIPTGRKPWGATIEAYDFVEAEGEKAMDAIMKSGRDPRVTLHDLAVKVDRELARP